MFNRTLDNSRRLTANNIKSDVYEGLNLNNIENYILGVSGDNLDLGTNAQ